VVSQFKMDSLYKRFGFKPSDFKDTLAQTGSFVAGGAAVHMLLGRDPAEFDGDIDIWYPNAPPRDGEDSDNILKINAYRYASKLIEEYIRAHGYQYVSDDIDFTREYTAKENPLNKEILSVTSFEGPQKRRVQIIYALNGAYEILSSFDYSFCSVACDAKNEFFGKDLELTKIGEGYPLMPSRSPERDKMRREKYEKRGFKILDVSSP
jgi:hypothetical protein